MFAIALIMSLVMAETKAPAKTATPTKAEVAVETPAPEVIEQLPVTGKVYGETDFPAPAMKLADVLKDFDMYKNKTVTIKAKVAQVCQVKGCWVRVEDKNISVRAIMKGHAFAVPKELKDKTVFISGTMEQKELPVKVVQHYMQDEGRSQDEIKKVNQPQKVFQFVVDGVQEI